MERRQLEEFLEDADERVEEIRRDAEGLRYAFADGRARRELIGRVFRAVHTLKGAAAAQGLAEVCAVAHEFESLLDAVRRGRAAADDATLDLFDAAADALEAQLRSAARGERADAPTELVNRLRRAARAEDLLGEEELWGEAEAALPFEVARSLAGTERARLREAAAEGARVFIVEAEFDADDFNDRFGRMCAALAEGGEIISAQPRVRRGGRGRLAFRVVYAVRQSGEELPALVAQFGATLTGSGEGAAGGASRPGSPPAATRREEVGPNAALPAYPVGVRVPLEELDELTAAAHELFRETLGVLEAGGAARAGAAGEAGAARVRRRFYEFEERLIGLRMVALTPTLERAARAGRAAARAAGRKVEFELRGGDVRVDKSLVDAVADPLLHLARNAAVHGVEPPAERAAAGKPARGRVRVEAVSEGARVTLRVTDDGRGVDAGMVARAAARRGLVPPGSAVDEGQALRLIFAPDFSTAEEVTGGSGRGVGLDVVERAVERAGGEVRARSAGGRGATFELRLPARLALVPSLVVRAGQDLYCLDSRRVVASASVARDQLAPERAAEGEAGESVFWRGQAVALVSLRALLVGSGRDGAAGEAARAGEAGGADAQVVSFVVMRGGSGRASEQVAFAVDELRGNEEVLARSLGRHAARWRGVGGAAELRDGTVALLLDPPRLLEYRF